MFFLWVFLPIVLILSRLIPKKGQNILLLLASLIFYAWGEPKYILLMLLAIAGNYLVVILMDRFTRAKKFYLIVAIVFNVGMLGIFKYTDFFIGLINDIAKNQVIEPKNIALPIGISFFTFQAMSYVFDYYRGEYKAEKNPLNVALYISFFPQLIAGPIVKYRDIRTQISERSMTSEKTVEGIRRFIYGLGKKVLIANTFASVVDGIYANDPIHLTGSLSWVAAVLYMLQIYYDFSGYSDMAIGLGKMFGFDILENFNYPYISTSIREFWRRWHISLGSWFRDYVYIPLGGNRKGEARTCLNLMIVFAVTGFWHGAALAFLFWGIFHGALQLLERTPWGKLIAKVKPLGWIYTTLAVMIGWILFRTESVGYSLEIIKRMFMPWKFTSGMYSMWEFVGARTVIAFVFAIILSGPLQLLLKKFCPKVMEKLKGSVLDLILCVGLLVLSILTLSANTYNPFIYFRF